MKRILLSLGLAMTLFPHAAGAAPSQVCDAVKGIAPVSSHYVQKALERADTGLQNVRSARANPTFERYLPSWALRIAGAVNGLVDSYLTLAVAQGDLLYATSCLRVDTLLLDCKIMEVQDELQAQLKKNSVWGIVQAESMLSFLAERKVHLARGALNPFYEDPTWDDTMEFDTRDETTPPAAAPPAQPMCPFDSDYAPPGTDGYGCDLSLLGNIRAYAPAESERNALQTLEDQINRYKALARDFSALESDLESLYDGTPAAAAGQTPAAAGGGHKELSGCQAQTPPADLRLRSVRSAFSYKKNEIGILSDFLGKRIAEGMFREHADDLKNPDEIKDDKERKEAERVDNPLMRLFREGARRFMESVSGNQGAQEAAVFATTPDGTMEIANALTDLRKSTGALSRLSATKDGLRGFVIRYAYFLRRSCIYRPCNQSLERVLRTAYADECFPYTDGAFLKDAANDPRWKKCAQAACIQVDGVTLPGNCRDVLP